VDLELHSSESNQIEIEIKNIIQSPEISIPEILQINKQLINNKNYVNLRTNNYIVSFPFSSGFIDSPEEIEHSLQNMKENIFLGKGFDSELTDMKVSNFFSEQNYILTTKNSIHVLEDNNNTILFDSQKTHFDIDQIYSIENSFHPKNLYLLSSEKIYIFDHRVPNPNKIIEKKKDLQRFFGLKHYFDQFLLLSTTKTFSFYDIRYPKNPVLEFRHFVEENPPTILDFSHQITDFPKNVSSFESDFRNFETIENCGITLEDDKQLLMAFSPNKAGSLIANILEKNLFEEGNNKDFMNLLEISDEPIFSYQKFQKPLNPYLLYSSNMRFDKYKISGVSGQQVEKNINLIFQNDNFGGLNLQIIKTENNRLKHLSLNFEGKQESENCNDLEDIKFRRLFEKKEEKKEKIQLKFGEDDNDDFSIDGELEPVAQEFEERNLKFRNLDKIFKKLLRESQSKNVKKGADIHSLKNEFPEEKTQHTFNKIGASQMNLEDMIFNLSTEELSKERKQITNYYNDNFLITEEIEEHLKAKWDEENKN